MIGPDDIPPGWKVEHVLRVTLPGDAATIDIVKDDGTPVSDWSEAVVFLEKIRGTMKRREAVRRRRRDIRRRRGPGGRSAE